jgi:hypothetical protein
MPTCGVGCAGDRRVQLPIPRDRLVTAATVVAEVCWEIQRFASPGAAVLLGRTDPPGAHQRHPHLPRPHHQQGCRWRRWTLVQAATTAIPDPDLVASPSRSSNAAPQDRPGDPGPGRLLTLCFYALRDDSGCRAYPHGSRWSHEGTLVCVMASLCDSRLLDRAGPAARHHG